MKPRKLPEYLKFQYENQALQEPFLLQVVLDDLQDQDKSLLDQKCS